jgi:hypothetical protein
MRGIKAFSRSPKPSCGGKDLYERYQSFDVTHQELFLQFEFNMVRKKTFIDRMKMTNRRIKIFFRYLKSS